MLRTGRAGARAVHCKHIALQVGSPVEAAPEAITEPREEAAGSREGKTYTTIASRSDGRIRNELLAGVRPQKGAEPSSSTALSMRRTDWTGGLA